MTLLKIENLHVEIEGKEILKGVDLELNTGKVNALMGKNGSGKSTLANTIMGHPHYKITKGKIIFDGVDITEMDVQERSKLGVFLSFQYPRQIEGVTTMNVLKQAMRARNPKLGIIQIKKILREHAKELDMDESFFNRYLNMGFSGGEKKKMEIIQMLALNPKLAILDETDSGLDVDALKVIAKGVNAFKAEDKGALIITHYKRILEHIHPDKVFIMKDGKITREGDITLVEKLEKEGYAFLDEEK